MKSALLCIPAPHQWSLPLWERGLKSKTIANKIIKKVSLPLWERGLKSANLWADVNQAKSLPLWERGLKFAGIEKSDDLYGRSPCGSVD